MSISSLSDQRILLTGATGFIGKALLPRIADRAEVHAITSSQHDKAKSDVQWHSVDLLDAEASATIIRNVKPTILVHLAWDLSGDFYEHPRNLDWANASFSLLRTFQKEGGRRALMIGTGYEYDTQMGYLTEERTPMKPSTLYGESKLILHQMASALARATDVQVVWGHVFFVYGPEESPNRLVPAVINALLEERPARCSHGRQMRDYLHVDDVASALKMLLQSDVEGTYNICSGEPVQLKEIISNIADELNGAHLVELGARESPSDEPPMIVGSCEKLHRDTGWKPSIPLERGLQETIRWWQANRKNHHVLAN